MQTFWHFLVWVCVIWYGTITLRVAWCGARDIRGMLDRLKEEERNEGMKE